MSPESKPPFPSVGKNQQFIDYIQDARKLLKTDNEITNALLSAGNSAQDI